MTQITVYRDEAANSVYIRTSSGAQFLNTLVAFVQFPAEQKLSIYDSTKEVLLASGVPYDEIIDENGDTYGVDALSVANELNSTVFTNGGGAAGIPPVITSPLTVNLTQGDNLNYTLTASNGVGFEWGNLPTGVLAANGNVRNLLGGTTLGVGTYNLTARAVNYYGVDEKTIDLIVSAPPYSNTKSVEFNNTQFCDADAAQFENQLGRTGNGSGGSDAWSMSYWFKPGTSKNPTQTMMYYGDSFGFFDGAIRLEYRGSNASRRNLRLFYGAEFNYLQLDTPAQSLTVGQWHHILVTYDGGTTGSASGDVNDYYSRFKVFIDGVGQTLSGSNANYGYSGDIPSEQYSMGMSAFTDYMRNGCRVDEFAIWGSDQSANIADIYNGGVTFDLSTLGTPPDHWYRMGDDDVYPTLKDQIDASGDADLTMQGMTPANIVTDAP